MQSWRICNDINTLSPEQWQLFNTNNNPFLSYSFLSGLERFSCLKNQYWEPAHIIIENNKQLVGFMPLYIKQDSYGEFVFDWTWADAYHRTGRQYYPKLVSAIPFTPVSGSRLLAKNNDTKTKSELLQAALNLMKNQQFSSLHVLFPDDNETGILLNQAGLKRLTCQYHWINKGYRDFKDFTDSLTSKKRKQILKERRSIQGAGIKIERLSGQQINEAHWDVFYRFYCATFYRKWGEPRFTLDFFKYLGKTLPEQTLLILAQQNNEYVAGAFAMKSDDTLYGRHWGCSRQVPYLHFELCYYQTIEHVIQHGLTRLDAGVQGEHKLARGFHPIAMPSVHWIRDNDFGEAIADYLAHEINITEEHIDNLNHHLPYKST